MNIEIISQKQYTAIMIAYLLGSSMVLGVGGIAKNDAWIAILIAMLISVPVLFVYARILSLFPNKGLYEILIIVFGKIAGKIIALFFIWYAFHLGSLVIRNFTEFIKTVTLPETPQYVTAFLLVILSIWAVKAGVEVIGRWTAIMLPIMITAIIAVSFLFIPILELRNFKPVLGDGFGPVINAAFSVYAFPFTEVVLFTVFACNKKNNGSPYKAFYWSLFIGGAIILLVTIRSLLSLGEANVSILYFSSYASVRLINIGDFLQRIEVSVAIIFMLGGFVKVAVCLYAACKGVASVLNFENYRLIVAPIGFLMMTLSLIIYNNIMEMFEWAEHIYKYYATPFEVILPLIIWIGAEIKVHSQKSQEVKQC